MLRILVKKQLAEVFKSYFYDAKKNRMRSKLAIAGWIVVILVAVVVIRRKQWKLPRLKRRKTEIKEEK